MRIGRILILALTLGMAGWQGHAATKGCYGALAAPLRAGGYSGDGGAYDCKDLKVDIKYVGRIVVQGRRFNIYDLIYETIPEQSDVAVHGGQRILIFRDRTYLGQFHLDTPPFFKVGIRGHSIHINTRAKYGNEVRLTKNGPPPNAFLAQDLDGLFR
ncbi:MAG TPA: hypothetical protein VGL73_12965 [Caulobacteraceae bacterium]|jgi:hypothetical protein